MKETLENNPMIPTTQKRFDEFQLVEFTVKVQVLPGYSEETMDTAISDAIYGQTNGILFDISEHKVIEEAKKPLQCPLGGDESNDCAECGAYGEEYHFVDGACVRRDEE